MAPKKNFQAATNKARVRAIVSYQRLLALTDPDKAKRLTPDQLDKAQGYFAQLLERLDFLHDQRDAEKAA